MNRDRTEDLRNVGWEIWDEIPWPECLIGEKIWYYDSRTGETRVGVVTGMVEEEPNGQA